MTIRATERDVGKTVCVIEDDELVRARIGDMLRAEGHTVFEAESADRGIDLIRTERADMIFCDILMPRLDGYQTCAIIKKNVNFSSIPVVMLSSKDGVFDKARGRMVGSQDYLTKPFTKDQLLQAVAQFGSANQGVM